MRVSVGPFSQLETLGLHIMPLKAEAMSCQAGPVARRKRTF